MINGPRRSQIDWNPTEIEASKVRKRRTFSRGFSDAERGDLAPHALELAPDVGLDGRDRRRGRARPDDRIRNRAAMGGGVILLEP